MIIKGKAWTQMKKITRITIQQKNKSRYNIFLNDEYTFSVDEAILIEFNLGKGLELDEKTIEAIIQKENVHKSYTQAIHYLSYRMRSRKEVYDYLEKKEVAHEQIEEIIGRLTKEKLINDSEFAEMFVRTRINTSNKGPGMIKNELREKGVSAAIADESLEQFSYEMQYEKVHKQMEKKLKGQTKDSFRKKQQQTQMSLMQKGFSQDVIKAVVAEFKGEKDEDKEWEALTYQGDKLFSRHSGKLEGFELRNKLTQGLHGKGFSFDLVKRFVNEKLEQ